MNKTKFKNPFLQAWDQYTQDTTTTNQERLVRSSQRIYQDKPFAQDHKKTFLISKFLRMVANVVSLCTCFVALQIVLGSLLGLYLASALAVLACLLLEVLKNSVWASTSKSFLKYRILSFVSILVLVGLHSLSIGASAFGAWFAPELLPQEDVPQEELVRVDSFAAKQIASINGQIDTLSNRTKENGTLSGNIRATIQELTNQKNELLQDQKQATKEAKEKNNAITQRNEKNAIEAKEKRDADLYAMRVSCLCIALFFELLYIACSVFVFYFLFRVYVDNQKDVPQDRDQGLEQGAQEDVPRQRSQLPIGFSKSCKNCGTQFKAKTTWQKFCKDDCRQDHHQKKKLRKGAKT